MRTRVATIISTTRLLRLRLGLRLSGSPPLRVSGSLPLHLSGSPALQLSGSGSRAVPFRFRLSDFGSGASAGAMPGAKTKRNWPAVPHVASTKRKRSAAGRSWQVAPSRRRRGGIWSVVPRSLPRSPRWALTHGADAPVQATGASLTAAMRQLSRRSPPAWAATKDRPRGSTAPRPRGEGCAGGHRRLHRPTAGRESS
jgi:hypothetical protein